MRRRIALALALSATFAVAPAAATAAGTVTATGTGLARVTPANRQSNASIVAAVQRAREESIVGAPAQAHSYAEDCAKAAGLTLGAVESVSDTQSGFYGFNPPYGPFGLNRYCGTLTIGTVKIVHGHKVVTRRRVHRCFVPPYAGVTLSVTYAAQ